MLIDVHAHLFYKDFEQDLEKVIERCKDFHAVINNGLDKETNRKVLELSKKYKVLKPALGLYPTEADKISEKDLEEEIIFIKKAKPVAIGEIGLDLKWLKTLDKQKPAFIKMLELAKALNVPAIIHSRKAEKEVVEILESLNMKKVIMHCYTGNLKLAKKVIEHKWYFSIPPIINHSDQFKQLVKEIPIQQLLTETDSPYLSHEKEKRNEPLNVQVSLKNIAAIKELDEEETKKLIFMNYKRLFEQ